jgi:branched-chain amino acid transport system substrate-binding protein
LRTRPRILTTLALAVPLALAVAACSGGSGTRPSGSGAATAGSGSGSGSTIVIGATLSLTGSLDMLGPPLEAGYKQEVADVNAAGGIAVGGTRHMLKLVVLDNGSDPGTASSQARELVLGDHAVALLGFATPQIVMPTALAAEQLRVPFLTSLMPVEAFASGNKDGWKYSWDFFYDERQQAADAAMALASVPGNKKVVLFTDNEPDGVVERPLYQAAFKADGLTVVGDYTFPAGTTDFSSYIADTKATGAQLLAGQMDLADGVALWKQVKSLGFHPKAAFLATAPDAGSWWQFLGSLAQDTLSEGFWSPSQADPGQLAAITLTLGKKYAGNPNYAAAAVGYAVAEVLTDALATAGSTNSGKLNTAISQTDAQTTAGPIKFNQATHTADTPYFITQWQDGKLIQVQPLASGVTFAVPVAGLG